MKLPKLLSLVLLVAAFGGGRAFAVVDEGIKMDWSSLKLKSYGTAKFDPAVNGSELKGLEKAAWQDGFKKIEAYYLAQEAFSSMDKKVLRELVRQHTQSTNTAYYADGSVRVFFETAYAEVLPKEDLGLKSDAVVGAISRSSGLVFDVKGSRGPSPTYRVVALGSGETLYSIENVAKESFAKNLMGRWLSPTAKKGLVSTVGDSPERLAMEVSGNDLAVDKDEWKRATEGNQALLHEARIAIVVQPK